MRTRMSRAARACPAGHPIRTSAGRRRCPGQSGSAVSADEAPDRPTSIRAGRRARSVTAAHDAAGARSRCPPRHIDR